MSHKNIIFSGYF